MVPMMTKLCVNSIALASFFTFYLHWFSALPYGIALGDGWTRTSKASALTRRFLSDCSEWSTIPHAPLFVVLRFSLRGKECAPSGLWWKPMTTGYL